MECCTPTQAAQKQFCQTAGQRHLQLNALCVPCRKVVMDKPIFQTHPLTGISLPSKFLLLPFNFLPFLHHPTRRKPACSQHGKEASAPGYHYVPSSLVHFRPPEPQPQPLPVPDRPVWIPGRYRADGEGGASEEGGWIHDEQLWGELQQAAMWDNEVTSPSAHEYVSPMITGHYNICDDMNIPTAHDAIQSQRVNSPRMLCLRRRIPVRCAKGRTRSQTLSGCTTSQ